MTRRVALVLGASLVWAPSTRSAELPAWLAEANARTVAPASALADAVVLHDEQIVQVTESGSIRVVTRFAVRVLRSDAADRAIAWVGYTKGSTEVGNFHAWTVTPNGTVVRKWSRKDASDVSDLERSQLYSESRHLALIDPTIQPPQTFAYEVVIEEKPLFAQWGWEFSGRDPSALSRFEIVLPTGLDVTVRSAQLDSAVGRHTAGRWSWEMRNQPARHAETLQPNAPHLEPFVWVQVVPATGDRSAAGVAFRDWRAVADWCADLARTQAALTADQVAHAQAIAGDRPDTLDRIRALAHYVQGLNYVSRDLNIGRGWGYRPHDAGTVLAAGYGDCKDKANLLCALLRSAGYDAWLLLVSLRGRDHVDSAWASPQQFNHCITAIQMPSSCPGPLLDRGRHGRLLAFDPTDPITAFGDLPEAEQGSWGLLVRPGNGSLIRLPVQPTEANAMTRRIDAELDPAGRLRATMIERSIGQSARDERELRRSRTHDAYQHVLEEWLPAQGGGVDIQSWGSVEDTIAGRYQLKIAFESGTFARSIGDRMLAFRGALLSPRSSWLPSDSARTMPIALPSTCVIETLAVRLPEGYAVDERPDDIGIESDLGRVDAKWTESGGALTMTRTWQLRPVTVGPNRWLDVRTLFAALKASNEGTVVLVRH